MKRHYILIIILVAAVMVVGCKRKTAAPPPEVQQPLEQPAEQRRVTPPPRPVGQPRVEQPALTECPTDVLVCPDGTVLNRQLPTCNFPTCEILDLERFYQQDIAERYYPEDF